MARLGLIKEQAMDRNVNGDAILFPVSVKMLWNEKKTNKLDIHFSAASFDRPQYN